MSNEADGVLTDEKGRIHRTIEWFHGDPLKVRRWVRALLAWIGAMGMMVIAPGIDSALSWTWQEWLKRLAIAGIFGIVGAINLGQKNDPVPEAAPVAAPQAEEAAPATPPKKKNGKKPKN